MTAWLIKNKDYIYIYNVCVCVCVCVRESTVKQEKIMYCMSFQSEGLL